MDSDDSKPRFEALRLGRENRAFARYFVTCCSLDRKRTLTHPEITDAIFREWKTMHDEGKIFLGCGMVMPDHIHWLFALGEGAGLPGVIGRFKSKTKRALGDHESAWQPNYYDHRIRPYESWENYAQYAFMNPYRANLLTVDAVWPGWIWPEPRRFQFSEHLDELGRPPASWISEIKRPPNARKRAPYNPSLANPPAKPDESP